MPYSANVYTLPPGTEATTLTPIDSSDYNAFVEDIEAAQNAKRPVVAGGTGGDSVITGWDGLAKKGSDIATASSINLTTATGPSLTLTGTTTITAVTLAEASFRLVRAAGAFQITASASLLCNGSSSVNMAVVAEDLLVFRGGAGGVVSVARIGAASLTFATPAQALAGTSTTLVVNPAGLYLPTGHLYGLTLTTNASDATNDIDIAAGNARDGGDTANMVLASALGKRLDAAWAVGGTPSVAVGGLDTGTVGNNTYYIWLIKRSDTGVVDALFSLSNSAPTMPTSYDLKRLRGCVVRSGGSNAAPQNGRSSSGGGPDIILEDQKSSGTGGMSVTASTNTLRELQTKVYDPLGLTTITSNTFSLAAGTYYIRWDAQVYRAGAFRTWLQNTTDSTVAGLGTSSGVDTPVGQFNVGFDTGGAVVTIAGTKSFGIYEYASNTNSGGGGSPASVPSQNEVYLHVEISKLA